MAKSIVIIAKQYLIFNVSASLSIYPCINVLIYLSIYLFIHSLYDSDDCSVPYQYTLIATDVCLDLSTSSNASSFYGSCDGKGELCCREHHTIDVSHVSCYDAIQSPLTAGTYSEYNITAKSFESDVCAASTLSETNRYSSSVCDESRRDDDYLLPFNSGSGMMHSTAFGQSLDRITKDRLRHEKQKQHSRSVVPISSATATAGIAGASSSSHRYSDYCLIANRAPSSSPSSRPSYGYGSPTPAPTKFKGVKFSASQVSNAHCLSVYLAFDESSPPMAQ